jgi:hypothetical protein
MARDLEQALAGPIAGHHQPPLEGVLRLAGQPRCRHRRQRGARQASLSRSQIRHRP